MKSEIVNAMTVDVEDYYQVGAFEKVIDKRDWSRYESRVERNTDSLLDLFNQNQIKCTFFSLGYVAERFPGCVRRITQEGHELASHGMDHRRVTKLTRQEYLDDLKKSKQVLEDVGGQPVIGYRAPSFSFTRENTWVYECLAESGYKYSSSVYPVKHDHYGIPDAPRLQYDAGHGITEIPMPTLKLGNKNLPVSGGGFFRLYPYWLTRKMIKHFNASEGAPYIFYLHPWEVDPEQPVVKGAPLKSRFRHYLNLSKTRDRLDRLTRDFRWKSMKDVFLQLD